MSSRFNSMWSPRSFDFKFNKEGVKRDSVEVGDPLYNCKSSQYLVKLVTHVELSMSSQVSQPYRAMKTLQTCRKPHDR